MSAADAGVPAPGRPTPGDPPAGAAPVGPPPAAAEAGYVGGGLRVLKAVFLGALLVALFPRRGAWLARLVCLGWLLEVTARVAEPARGAGFPSWRTPWAHLKRGLGFVIEAGLLLAPASFLVFVGWRAGWIISFEHVPDYHAFGAQTVLAGLALTAPLAWLMPALTVQAALAPGTRAAWDLPAARRRVAAAPVTYGLLVAASFLPWIPLEVTRALIPKDGGEAFFHGLLSFGFALGTKALWGRWHRRAAAKDAAGHVASAWLRVPLMALGVLAGFGYAVAIVLRQFLLWESEAAWFAHWLFLLPGTPAPLGAVAPVYW